LGGWDWGYQPFTVQNKFVKKNQTEPQTWMNSLDKRPKQRNMDMRFGTWNVKSLYKAGSLIMVLSELSKYKLDLVGVQVRLEGSGTKPVENTHFSMERGMRIMN
jgi:hypothetical protein